MAAAREGNRLDNLSNGEQFDAILAHVQKVNNAKAAQAEALKPAKPYQGSPLEISNYVSLLGGPEKGVDSSEREKKFEVALRDLLKQSNAEKERADEFEAKLVLAGVKAQKVAEALKQAQKEVATLTEENRKLKTGKAAPAAELVAANERVRILTADIEARSRDEARLRGELDARIKEKDMLKHDVSNLGDVITGLRKTIEEASSDADTQDLMIKGLQDEINEVDRLLSVTGAGSEALRKQARVQKIKDLNNRPAGGVAVAPSEATESRLIELQQTIQELSKRLDKTNTELQQSQEKEQEARRALLLVEALNTELTREGKEPEQSKAGAQKIPDKPEGEAERRASQAAARKEQEKREAGEREQERVRQEALALQRRRTEAAERERKEAIELAQQQQAAAEAKAKVEKERSTREAKEKADRATREAEEREAQRKAAERERLADEAKNKANQAAREEESDKEEAKEKEEEEEREEEEQKEWDGTDGIMLDDLNFVRKILNPKAVPLDRTSIDAPGNYPRDTDPPAIESEELHKIPRFATYARKHPLIKKARLELEQDRLAGKKGVMSNEAYDAQFAARYTGAANAADRWEGQGVDQKKAFLEYAPAYVKEVLVAKAKAYSEFLDWFLRLRLSRPTGVKEQRGTPPEKKRVDDLNFRPRVMLGSKVIGDEFKSIMDQIENVSQWAETKKFNRLKWIVARDLDESLSVMEKEKMEGIPPEEEDGVQEEAQPGGKKPGGAEKLPASNSKKKEATSLKKKITTTQRDESINDAERKDELAPLQAQLKALYDQYAFDIILEPKYLWLTEDAGGESAAPASPGKGTGKAAAAAPASPSKAAAGGAQPGGKIPWKDVPVEKKQEIKNLKTKRTKAKTKEIAADAQAALDEIAKTHEFKMEGAFGYHETDHPSEDEDEEEDGLDVEARLDEEMRQMNISGSLNFDWNLDPRRT